MIFAKWDVTGQCNLCCKHCSVGQVYEFGRKEKSISDLDTAEMLQAVEKLVAGGVSHVQILGGEPFARKDLLQILKKLSEAGVKILINTNGHLVSDDVLDQLLQLNIEILNFSFDGPTAAINDQIRGEGSFAKTLARLRRTMEKVQAAGAEMLVGVNFVITRESLYAAAQLAQFCRENGIKELSVNDLWVTQNAELSKSEIALQSLDQKFAFVDELIRTTRDLDIHLKVEMLPMASGYFNYKYGTKFQTLSKCVAGENVIYIQADGQVYPCIKCRDKNELVFAVNEGKAIPHLWNIKDNTLVEILESPYFQVFRKFRQSMEQKLAPCDDCPYLDYCTPCPFIYATSTVMEECTYIDNLLNQLVKEAR